MTNKPALPKVARGLMVGRCLTKKLAWRIFNARTKSSCSMKHQYIDMSYSDMLVLKQLNQEQKIAALRSLSNDDRKQLNERNAELCEKISSEFGKSRRLVL